MTHDNPQQSTQENDIKKKLKSRNNFACFYIFIVYCLLFIVYYCGGCCGASSIGIRHIGHI